MSTIKFFRSILIIVCMILFGVNAYADAVFSGFHSDTDVRIDDQYPSGTITYQQCGFDMGPSLATVDMSHSMETEGGYFYPSLGSTASVSTISLHMGPSQPSSSGYTEFTQIWFRVFDYDNSPYPMIMALDLGFHKTGSYVECYDGDWSYIGNQGFVSQTTTTDLKIEITTTTVTFKCSSNNGSSWSTVYTMTISSAPGSHNLTGYEIVVGIAASHSTTSWKIDEISWTGDSVPDVNVTDSPCNIGDAPYDTRLDLEQLLEPEGNEILHGAGALETLGKGMARFSGSTSDTGAHIDELYSSGTITYGSCGFTMGPGAANVGMSHNMELVGDYFYPSLGSSASVSTISLRMGPSQPSSSGYTEFTQIWFRVFDYDNSPYPMIMALDLGFHKTGAYVECYDGDWSYIGNQGFVSQNTTTDLKIEITTTTVTFKCSSNNGSSWSTVYTMTINNAPGSHNLTGYEIVVGIAASHSTSAWPIDMISWEGNYVPNVNMVIAGCSDGAAHANESSVESSGGWKSFKGYRTELGSSKKPVLAMSWVGLHRNIPVYGRQVKSLLDAYPDEYIIPQVGLMFCEEEVPETHYEDEVAAGYWDTELDQLIDCFEDWDRPVLLRVGFAFNFENNGYDEEDYIDAFQYTHDYIENAGLTEVALVWDYAPWAEDTSYTGFYPGDAYVDWWSIEIFDIADVSRTCTLDFLEDAETAGKPVLIGESTAYTMPSSWSGWFGPFFEFVRIHRIIKGYCYINWDWTQYPAWSSWGDCRIEAASQTIQDNYAAQLGDSAWFHNAGESTVRSGLYLP